MTKRNRYDLIDALRGLAILEMFIFHFCFLLYEFGLGFDDFYGNPYWRGFRVVIVTSFLTLVGVSLRIACEGGLNVKSYYRRLAQLLIYGAAVSVATYIYEPRRVVIFGILQFILVASVLGLLFVKLGWKNLLLGGMFILLGLYYHNEAFNSPWLFWMGMGTKLPITLDYVPLLPWFGVVLIGIYIGEQIINNPKLNFVKSWQVTDPVTRTLALMGRHSLNLYMAHVPVFYVFIYLVWMV